MNSNYGKIAVLSIVLVIISAPATAQESSADGNSCVSDSVSDGVYLGNGEIPDNSHLDDSKDIYKSHKIRIIGFIKGDCTYEDAGKLQYSIYEGTCSSDGEVIEEGISTSDGAGIFRTTYETSTNNVDNLCLEGKEGDEVVLEDELELNLKDTTYRNGDDGYPACGGSGFNFNAKLVKNDQNDASDEFPNYDNALIKGCWKGEGAFETDTGFKDKRLRGLMINVGYTDEKTGNPKTSWASQPFNVNPEQVGTAISGNCVEGEACSFASIELEFTRYEGDGGVFKFKVLDGKSPQEADGPVDIHVEMAASTRDITGGGVKGGEDGYSDSELRNLCDKYDGGNCELVNQIDFTINPEATAAERSETSDSNQDSDQNQDQQSSGEDSSGSSVPSTAQVDIGGELSPSEFQLSNQDVGSTHTVYGEGTSSSGGESSEDSQNIDTRPGLKIKIDTGDDEVKEWSWLSQKSGIVLTEVDDNLPLADDNSCLFLPQFSEGKVSDQSIEGFEVLDTNNPSQICSQQGAYDGSASYAGNEHSQSKMNEWVKNDNLRESPQGALHVFQFMQSRSQIPNGPEGGTLEWSDLYYDSEEGGFYVQE